MFLPSLFIAMSAYSTIDCLVSGRKDFAALSAVVFVVAWMVLAGSGCQ